jgi:hypothetical protein
MSRYIRRCHIVLLCRFCRLRTFSKNGGNSQQHPDIATATITGPEAVGDKLVYRFTRAIGTKG